MQQMGLLLVMQFCIKEEQRDNENIEMWLF